MRGIVGNVGLVNSIGYTCECLLLLLMHAICCWEVGAGKVQRLETKEKDDDENVESRVALCGIF